ncbi:hypothetical protein CDO52_18170 [Nocardiopsis gilva YIM 90087]|uniref:DUF1059 domain-containing protein n=1 Tax=Nocardiopsis gilva YIM 90087 TaxID=1235441 RepID=A0A223S8N2_9ACTN|nr:hypothetical protein [Nocardiopsis gilva]ASU84471.1 hypothetical protein CDO52_18170 [Nocardiopsis gilva YIM 90087]
MAYRYRCGECTFKTGWITESEAEDRAVAHYADHHPQLIPGGMVEFNAEKRDSHGCLGCIPVVAILFLLLMIASSCEG